MLERIISGGQTGVDQAALRAARACGLETGGWAPLGWETEDGPAPWLAVLDLVECEKAGYPARTRANARDSDATLWFGYPDSAGGETTLRACARLGKATFEVLDDHTPPSDVAAWIVAEELRVLNVAGNRESKAPGIGARAERFLIAVFR
jgi:hypothetical protein